jgi:hypothetical protein
MKYIANHLPPDVSRSEARDVTKRANYVNILDPTESPEGAVARWLVHGMELYKALAADPALYDDDLPSDVWTALRTAAEYAESGCTVCLPSDVSFAGWLSSNDERPQDFAENALSAQDITKGAADAGAAFLRLLGEAVLDGVSIRIVPSTQSAEKQAQSPRFQVCLTGSGMTRDIFVPCSVGCADTLIIGQMVEFAIERVWDGYQQWMVTGKLPDEFHTENLVRDPDGVVVSADSEPTFASPQPEDWHGPSELPRLSRETMEQEMRKNIEKCDGWRAELANVRQLLCEALRSTDPAVFTQAQVTAWLKVYRAHSQLSAVLKAMGAGNVFATADESTLTLTDSDRVTITPEFARTVLLRDPTVVVLELDVLRSWAKTLRDKGTLDPVGGVLDWFERIIQQREAVAGPPADEPTTEGADQDEPTDGD